MKVICRLMDLHFVLWSYFCLTDLRPSRIIFTVPLPCISLLDKKILNNNFIFVFFRFNFTVRIFFRTVIQYVFLSLIIFSFFALLHFGCFFFRRLSFRVLFSFHTPVFYLCFHELIQLKARRDQSS